VDLTDAPGCRSALSAVRACAVALAVAAAIGAMPLWGGAESVLTPGVAAGGVPLDASVDGVRTILGAPSNELRDPTNRGIIIQRWEARCLGARYTAAGMLVALDVWSDLGDQCGGTAYTADGAGGRRVTFGSMRAAVKAAFGYAPSRVLRALSFTIIVYDDQGIAFYVRGDGPRQGLVDAITVFRRGGSRSVWTPDAWGGR
jgi:hypothetical protein